MSRRAFMLAAGGVAAGIGGLAGDAFTGATHRVQLTRGDIPVPGLPGALDGIRVAHLSDIHLYDGLHEAALRAMQLTREARPDVTIVTGDVVETADQLEHASVFLAGIPGRLATVVTLGNWEHAAGVSPGEMNDTCRSAGAQFLLNEAVVLDAGARPLAIVGLDDPRAGVAYPDRALRTVPPWAVSLWAFHSPGYADELIGSSLPAPAAIFAGHTHGGQIRPPLLPAITPPGSGRFVAGWYRDSFAPLYVSRGVGTTDIRARLFCPPEVGLFTLRSV
jgi:hypothetical protein